MKIEPFTGVEAQQRKKLWKEKSNLNVNTINFH